MRLLPVAAAALAAAALPSPASAQEATNAFTQCLIRSASPEDRTMLIRWLFSALGSNPVFDDLVRIDEATRVEIARSVARIFNHLVLSDCRPEALAALRENGQQAFFGAFTALGQFAGMELMLTPDAARELQRFAQFLDTAGLEALGREAGAQAGAPPQ
jgi:hypothetical protein